MNEAHPPEFPHRRPHPRLAHARLSSASSLGSADTTGSAAALSSGGVAQELQGSSNSLARAIGSGKGERRTLHVDGRDREYLLALPQTFDPARTYPVIFAFCGWQHTATDMRYYAATSLTEDFIYVSAIIDELVADYSARRSDAYAAGQVPALFVHGTADDVIAYIGGVRHGAPCHSVDETFRAPGSGCGPEWMVLGRKTVPYCGIYNPSAGWDSGVETRFYRHSTHRPPNHAPNAGFPCAGGGWWPWSG